MESDGALSDNNNNNNEEASQAPPVEKYPLPQDAPPYLLSDEVFVPRADLMEKLTSEWGFSENAAKKALYWTGNQRLDSAIDWLCDRSHSTYETPLEEEISQLRSEFDRRREEMDSRSSLEDTEERVSDEDDGDEIDLVLVLNRRLKSRYSSFVWMRFVEETTKDIVYKMSLTTAGQESLTKWARRPEGVLVRRAESSQLLIDLQLCANSLSLHTELSGLVCTMARPDLRDHMVLAVGGPVNEVEKAVGRIFRF